MKKDEEPNSNQTNPNEDTRDEEILGGDGTATEDIQIQHRYKIIGFEENTIAILFTVLCILLSVVFYFTTNLPDDDTKYKHDLVSRIVCDKVLPFADEISKETNFSDNIKKIEVNGDGVEVSAVLDESTIGMPNDITKIEISTEIKDGTIKSLSGRVVLDNMWYVYAVLDDKITVREDSGAIKPYNYTFLIQSCISTWSSDELGKITLAGFKSLVCILALLGVYKIVINMIRSNKKGNQHSTKKVNNREVVAKYFLNILQLLWIIVLICVATLIALV